MSALATGALALPSLLQKAKGAPTSVTPPVDDRTPAYFRSIPQTVAPGTFRRHPNSLGIDVSSTTLLPPVDFDRIRTAVIAGNMNREFATNRLGFISRLEFSGWPGLAAFANELETRVRQLNPYARLARGENGKPIFIGTLASMSERFSVLNSMAMNLSAASAPATFGDVFVFDQRPILKVLSAQPGICLAPVGAYHPALAYLSCPACVNAPKSFAELPLSRHTASFGFTDGKMTHLGNRIAGYHFPATVVFGEEDPRLVELWYRPVENRVGTGTFAYVGLPANSAVPVGLPILAGQLLPDHQSNNPAFTPIGSHAQISTFFNEPWKMGLTLRPSVNPLSMQGLGVGQIPGITSHASIGAQEVLNISALVIDQSATSSSDNSGPGLSVGRIGDAVRLRILHSGTQSCAVAVYRSPTEAGLGSPWRMLPVPDGGPGDISEVVRKPEHSSEFYSVVMTGEARGVNRR